MMTRACTQDISESDKHSTENQKFKLKELQFIMLFLTPIIILMPNLEIRPNGYTIESHIHCVLRAKHFHKDLMG